MTLVCFFPFQRHRAISIALISVYASFPLHLVMFLSPYVLRSDSATTEPSVLGPQTPLDSLSSVGTFHHVFLLQNHSYFFLSPARFVIQNCDDTDPCCFWERNNKFYFVTGS